MRKNQQDDRFGELRRQIREKFDFTYQFSNRVGCHPSKVAHVLSGRQGLRPFQKKLWASVLGCTVKDLFPPDSSKN